MKPINVLLLCIMSACLTMAFRWPSTPKPDAGDRTQDLSDVASRVMPTIAKLQAENYRDVAKQLRSGQLKNDGDSGESLAKRNKAAIDAAFKPLDELLQAALGDGKWTSAKAAETYEELATGLERSAR